MIFSIDCKEQAAPAVITDGGRTVTYGELAAEAAKIGESAGGRYLVFCLCRNVPAAVAGYLGFVSSGAVPLLLDADIDSGVLSNLDAVYKPQFYWLPENMAGRFEGTERVCEYDGYVLVKTGNPPYELGDGLALLLATSGSTGSPKLVRLSRRNIEANAESIRQYLGITADERPITTLPMNYTYGLSIINSHLLAGACILMTESSVVQMPFWQLFMSEGATSFGGVPYTYEILKKLRFFTMKLPSLRTMTQAGGKLPTSLQEEFGRWAEEHGVKLVVMYGQTEATARMSYLPPEMCLKKIGSMGVAIPGGKFRLLGADGEDITQPGVSGELIYEGENVSLGYAECASDLRKGDERCGVLQTGDIAKRDEDGYYYIVGRKKRFIKIYGIRVSLDECEQLLKNNFSGADFACVGRDDGMVIFTSDAEAAKGAADWLAGVLRQNIGAFRCEYIEKIPKNDAGKTIYKELEAGI